MSRDLTQEELIEALQRMMNEAHSADGFHTVRELTDAAGTYKERVRELLHEARKRGILEMRKVPRETLAGYVQKVPAFRINTDG